MEGNEIRGRKSLMNKLPPGLDKLVDKGRELLGYKIKPDIEYRHVQKNCPPV